MTELAPCPFCGGEAVLKISKNALGDTIFIPQCKNPKCCGRSPKGWTNREKAVAKWNRRGNYSLHENASNGKCNDCKYLAGQRLRELRHKKGLSGVEAAQKCFVSISQYYKYEQNSEAPKGDILQRLCDLYGCSKEYLIGRVKQ